MSKILALISRRYNANELWPVLKVFKKRGHTFETVSSSKVIYDEVTGRPNSVAHVAKDLTTVKGFDAIVVISGNPSDTEFFWYDKHTQDLVVEASKENIVIAAICAAVPTIRKAAVGKTVSAFPLVKITGLLNQAGVNFSRSSISTDGKIVTAETEAMSVMWAINICDVLEGKPPTYIMFESAFKRKNRPIVIKEIQHLLKGNTHDPNISSK